MKKKSIFAVLAMSLVAIGTSQAALVAYWHFNDLPDIEPAAAPGVDDVPTLINADVGIGEISLTGWGGTVDDFTGTTLNNYEEAVAGKTLSLINGSGGNGTYIDISFSTTGLTDISVSFATRGTGTGFSESDWEYSTDGGATFTSLGENTATRSTSFSVVEVDLSGVTAVENQSQVTLRYTLDGALTATGANSASGNNRIDNLQINAIPEPASILLGAMGALALLRRRNR